MPEGDTVANHAAALQRALAGAVIRGSDFRTPRLATVDVRGWTVAESAVRGKHLLLRLTPPEGSTKPPHTLHSHLRMDGTWRTYKPGERWHGRPAHTIRVVLKTDTATAVGFHLHDVALVPTAEEEVLVGHLGPDLLGPDWDADEAERRLRADPDREIAEALLDQRNLAGIGNLYKSEVLFLRGVSPWQRVGDVADLPALVGLAQRLLKSNLGRWSQVTTGSLRRGEENYVYGRRGLSCRRCGTPIRKQEQGERVTYWCPTCQPGTPVG
jgi:endonuclease VIII